jgi:hypothetical protein
VNALDAEAAERNRRASFRINDRVGLRLRLLGESEYRAQRGRARTRHGRQQQLNSILAAGESQRGALRKLRDTDPTLAGYLQGLEERLEALLRLLGEDEQSAPEAPTHDVNLSGNGIRFRHPEALARGAHVELALRLIPVAHLPESDRHGGARECRGSRTRQRRPLRARGGFSRDPSRRPRTADPTRAQPAARACAPWPAARLRRRSRPVAAARGSG